MNFFETPLKGSYIIEINPLKDNRGYFERLYCKKEMHVIGFTKEIIQINHSFSVKKGTLRGMHFQKPPYAEAKFIKCIKGSVLDIAVDIRMKSPTFLSWFSVELTENNNRMYYLPEGFAHGFQTLQENTELLYFHSEFYNPENEGAINYKDPILNLTLNHEITDISKRDSKQPFIIDPFAELPNY